MPQDSEGARRLRVLTLPTVAQAALAERCGCSRQTISSIAKGDTKPGVVLAVKLAEAAGIPVATWAEPPAPPGDGADAPSPGETEPDPPVMA